MKVDLSLQFAHDQTLPCMPVKVNTGSALPLELVGIPERLAGGVVDGVSVELVNADGEPLSAACEKVGEMWAVLFAPSNFANYGFVKLGFRAVVTVTRGELPSVGVSVGGDLEIVAASASATAGVPSSAYQVSGGDVYLKSRIVEGVQHYVRQSMVYDARIGWGAEWGGDYIKTADGGFVEYTEG